MTKERTFIAVKPEGVQRHFVGEIISRFEKRGLKLVGIKMVAPDEDLMGKHYPNDQKWFASLGKKTIEGYKAKGIEIKETAEEVGQRVRKMLMDYMKDRPVIAMVWEGAHAVELGRKTAGSTNPLTAETGTIRGDFTQESYEVSDALGRPIQNLVHASGSVEDAKNEINLWFKPEEVVDYDLVFAQIMSDDKWGRVKK